MLRKLLKYDLRANLRIFLFIWPAIIVFALMTRFAIAVDLGAQLSTVVRALTITLFVFGVIGACVFTLIITVIRFYGGLLRDEGYLMFTLPAKPWQLILSKFLTALLTVIVTVCVCILATLLMLNGAEEIRFAVQVAVRELKTSGALPTLLGGGLLCLVAFAFAIMQIYLACSIGHLFRRMRIFFSILAYYAINVTIEAVTLVGTLLLGQNHLLFYAMVEIPQNAETLAIWVTTGALAVVGTAFFFGCERILRKRLNLE